MKENLSLNRENLNGYSETRKATFSLEVVEGTKIGLSHPVVAEPLFK